MTTQPPHRAEHTADPVASSREAEAEGATPSPLDALLASPLRPRWPEQPMFVATCVDTQHPTLRGRVRVRWADATPDAPTGESWVPTLQGLALRSGDRVLLSHASGIDEPLVIGVVDGFMPRPDRDRTPAAVLELQPDQVLRIQAQDGQQLVDIIQDETGPIVRVLQADTRIDVRGRLTITAAELELKAVRGDVQIEASDKVSVVGETVRLN